jgi:predicted regulator of Ras-like GTPase activity (Roadblock/LC7/MglB family)
MEMGPLIMTSLAQRLTPEGKAGKLECVIACFEKDYVLMAKVGDGYLAVSVEREQALTIFQEIIPRILKL